MCKKTIKCSKEDILEQRAKNEANKKKIKNQKLT